MSVWFLVLLDLLAVALGIECAAAVLREFFFPLARLGFAGTTLTTTAALGTAVVGAYLTGLDDFLTMLDRRTIALRCVLVALATSLTVLVVSHYVWYQPVGRIALGLIALCVASFSIAWRFIYSGYIERGPRIPMIMVGDSPSERMFARELNQLRHIRYRVVGFVADAEESGPHFLANGSARATRPSPAERGRRLAAERDPSLESGEGEAAAFGRMPPGEREPAVLGGFADAVEVFARHGVTRALVVSTSTLTPRRLGVLTGLQAQGVRVSTAGTFWMNVAKQVPVALVDARWVINTFDQLDRPLVGEAKRLVDVVASVVGLAMLVAAFPVLYVVVKLDSPGPFLYAQRRAGFGGREFTLYKLRTMRVAADGAKERWAARVDARTTRVGRVLRRLRVDEFPQFFNVLRGDMSLVGPRPEQPNILLDLERRISFFRYRNLVKPGITGWAQINQGYAASVAASEVKLSYDLYYVARHTLLLDLDIILRTLFVMLARIGAR
ncbi:MAG: sugar transferase [Nannocystaceae bacterium]